MPGERLPSLPPDSVTFLLGWKSVPLNCEPEHFLPLRCFHQDSSVQEQEKELRQKNLYEETGYGCNRLSHSV